MTTPHQLNDASLICPITGERMKDPVVDHEGNSYEKSAILDWLSRNPISPITRSPLTVQQLTPNRALKALVEVRDLGKDTSTMSTPPSTIDRGPDVIASTRITAASDGHVLVQVSIADEDGPSRKPACIVCVIDVSGSMESPATMHGDSEGSGGLSLLDIVKHATLTVIETLSPQDRLAIISYSNSASLLLPPTFMTLNNKTLARAAVKQLYPTGGTNLWAGLAQALDICKLEQDICNVILLTDGQPNISPPRGEVETLKKYRKENPEGHALISTFGFGYHLDSKLLRDICELGKGHYCFIPDSSFVGTVFVNATANILATALPESTLVIKSEDAITNLSGLECSGTSDGLSFDLPPLIYGQTFDVLVKVSSAMKNQIPNLCASLRHTRSEVQWATKINISQDNDSLKLAKARSSMIQFISESEQKLSIDKGGHTFESIKKCLDLLVSINAEESVVEAIEADLRGQITEAYSRPDWHKKWGRHYLLSLARAHVLQQCTNFKDPGVQAYATKKFSVIRDIGEDLFCKLTPPQPSRRPTQNYTPVRSMTRYYSSATPCFAKGLVALADGSHKDISKLCAGDLVKSRNTSARVKCIIKTPCDGTERLVKLDGGVLVTPWHPVREVGSTQWSFPADIAPIANVSCDAVYSFVLDDGATCLSLGSYYEGIALGHGIIDDPVATHSYLGTQRVLDDLAKMPGWTSGFIQLGLKPCRRDPKTQLITHLSMQRPSTLEIIL